MCILLGQENFFFLLEGGIYNFFFVFYFFFLLFVSVSFGADWDKAYFKLVFFFLLFSNLNGLCGSWNIIASWPFCLIFLSFMFWLNIVFYWGLCNYKTLLCHLVPLGINVLGLFPMFLIELRSLFIRPFTLSLRLMVNILAGMLFFDLIESFGFGFFSFFFLGCYEAFVCFMQSLIYSLLVLNYNEEGFQRV